MLEYQILFQPILNLFARSDDMSEDSDDDIDTVTDTETDPGSDMTDSTKEAGDCTHNEGNFLEKIQVYLLWKFKKNLSTGYRVSPKKRSLVFEGLSKAWDK